MDSKHRKIEHMATMDAAALRAARMERLAKEQGASPAPSEPPKGTQPQSPIQGSTPQPAAPAASAAPAAAAPVAPPASPPAAPPAEVSAKVVDPTQVPRNADVTLHLFGEGSSDPHWMVAANGMPVAEIRLSAQEDPQRIARLFVSEKYAQGIREAAKSMGLAEVLQGVKARPYIAAVSGSETFKSLETQAKTAAVEDLRKARANLRDGLLNMLGLVVEAQNRNYLTENPLKDGLFTRLVKAGIDQGSAVHIIEAAWQEKAPEHFEFLFKQAARYMDMSPEALTEIRENIMGTPHRVPTIAATAGGSIPVAPPKQPPAAPRAAGNVPLSTYGNPEGNAPTAPATEKDAMRDTFGFRARRLTHTMPAK